jgi:hypothetical protein
MHLLCTMDLELSYFHFCDSLCKLSEANPFKDDGEMKAKLHWWVQMLSPYFFLAGIEYAEYCWDIHISWSGSYVQKLRVFPFMPLILDIFMSGTVVDVAH